MLTLSWKVTDAWWWWWGWGENRDGGGGVEVCRRGRDAKLCQTSRPLRAAPGSSVKDTAVKRRLARGLAAEARPRR